MSTTAIGRQAERVAAVYLQDKGYQIVKQNWRTRWCEIDIVAVRGDTVIFVEVKYRQRDLWGSGIDYIGPVKYKQLAFAAEFWMAQNKWAGPCHLAAVEVSGPQFLVTAFVPEL